MFFDIQKLKKFENEETFLEYNVVQEILYVDRNDPSSPSLY